MHCIYTHMQMYISTSPPDTFSEGICVDGLPEQGLVPSPLSAKVNNLTQRCCQSNIFLKRLTSSFALPATLRQSHLHRSSCDFLARDVFHCHMGPRMTSCLARCDTHAQYPRCAAMIIMSSGQLWLVLADLAALRLRWAKWAHSADRCCAHW